MYDSGNESIPRNDFEFVNVANPMKNGTRSRLRERLYQIEYRIFELKAELYDLQNERIEIVMNLWNGYEPIVKKESMVPRARFDDGSFVQLSCPKITPSPTRSPTKKPTENPTTSPTELLTASPTNPPTSDPTVSPTNNPTEKPTSAPTTDPTISPAKSPTNRPTPDDDSLLEAYRVKDTMIDLYEVKYKPKEPKTAFDALADTFRRQGNYDLIITKFGFNDTIIKSYHKDIDVLYDGLYKMGEALALNNMTIAGLGHMSRVITEFQEYCGAEGFSRPDTPNDTRNVICRLLYAKNQTAANLVSFKAFAKVFMHANEIKTSQTRQRAPTSDLLDARWEKRSQNFMNIFVGIMHAIQSGPVHSCVPLIAKLQTSMNEVTDMKQLFVIVQILDKWRSLQREKSESEVKRICIIIHKQLSETLRAAIRIGMPSAIIGRYYVVWNGQKWKFRIFV